MPELVEISATKTSSVIEPGDPLRTHVRSLPNTGVRWLIENIDQGCSLLSLETVMRENGFDAELARIAVICIHEFHVTESAGHNAATRQLKPDWQQWLRENIQRGCNREFSIRLAISDAP